MYDPEKILTGAPNARDLGGIETANGRRIKPNRLIRSGMLARLTDEDVEYLKSAGLKTIVDFRTSAERVQKPDRQIDNVEYIVCPMLEDKTEGITRDKPESEDEEAQRTLKMAHRLMATDPDGVRQMRSLYPILVTLDHSIEHYRKFFEILLNHEDGALLYHCTMGKDRVGTATALLLTALLCLPVWQTAYRMLRDGRVGCELCASSSSLSGLSRVMPSVAFPVRASLQTT